MVRRRRPTKRKSKRDSRLKRAGVRGFNKPKRTPGHKTKSHIVVAKVGSRIKTIRFGQKGAKTAGTVAEWYEMKIKNGFFKDKLFKTYIHRNVRLSEAPSFGKPALLYDANSTGARNYMSLTEEILQRVSQ